ncbi:MAG: cupin domain-containing protein [Bryobacterales bacterium]|nr:cupin domain-containing protein [Bryobacterales bacterium]
MTEKYTFVSDLREHVQVPARGILSTTLQADERSKVIQFVFAPGEELSAHTAPFPAILYIVKGDADLTLGEDAKQASEGTLVHMTAQLPHSVKARTEVVMLLIMLRM